MGDRANIVIESDKDFFPHAVFFYTHWRGSDIKTILQSALVRGKDRWNDPQYLSRVIFCELIGKDTTGITGFGITTKIGDGGGKLLCVNMDGQKVRERDSRNDETAAILTEWSFVDYIAAKFTTEEDDGD